MIPLQRHASNDPEAPTFSADGTAFVIIRMTLSLFETAVSVYFLSIIIVLTPSKSKKRIAVFVKTAILIDAGSGL